jgi:hypothetical protein
MERLLQMILKLILRYYSFEPLLDKIFQLGNVGYAKDSLEVLHDTKFIPVN